jgi:hypothetical protein
MKRFIEISVFALLVCVIGYLGWLVGFDSRHKNRSSKAALTQMHQSLRLGDPQRRVVELYDQFRTDRTEFREHDKTTWEIGMPFELGCGDWILYLEFDDSQKLSAAVFRTSDGIFHRPPDSPEDKGEFALATKYKNPG